MEEIVKVFTQLGITGAVLALLVYDVFYLQKKLVSIIENNTVAMTKLVDQIKELQTLINYKK